MSYGEPGGFSAPTEQIYGNLSYEQLLAKACDRCLHYRVVAKDNMYVFAVQALHLALVDIGGRPLRSLADDEWEQINASSDSILEKSDKMFTAITRILSKHKLLFRSVLVEVGREQVY